MEEGKMRKGMMSEEQKAAMAEGRRKALEKKKTTAEKINEPEPVVPLEGPEVAESEPCDSPKTKSTEVFGVYVASGTEENFRNLMRSLNGWQDKAYANGVRDTLAWILGDSPNAPTGTVVVSQEIAS
jgi:hypothetical protein